MRKIILFVCLTMTGFTVLNCSSDTDCGYVNGKQLHKGPQGGCYYVNDAGNKVYVDRSQCSC